MAPQKPCKNDEKLVLETRKNVEQNFLVSKNAVIDEVRAWVLANDPRTYAETRQVLASGVTELILRQKPICTPTLVITCENDSGSNPEMAYAIGSD